MLSEWRRSCKGKNSQTLEPGPGGPDETGILLSRMKNKYEIFRKWGLGKEPFSKVFSPIAEGEKRCKRFFHIKSAV